MTVLTTYNGSVIYTLAICVMLLCWISAELKNTTAKQYSWNHAPAVPKSRDQGPLLLWPKPNIVRLIEWDKELPPTATLLVRPSHDGEMISYWGRLQLAVHACATSATSHQLRPIPQHDLTHPSCGRLASDVSLAGSFWPCARSWTMSCVGQRAHQSLPLFLSWAGVL